jgi:hypothetical protein
MHITHPVHICHPSHSSTIHGSRHFDTLTPLAHSIKIVFFLQTQPLLHFLRRNKDNSPIAHRQGRRTQPPPLPSHPAAASIRIKQLVPARVIRLQAGRGPQLPPQRRRPPGGGHQDPRGATRPRGPPHAQHLQAKQLHQLRRVGSQHAAGWGRVVERVVRVAQDRCRSVPRPRRSASAGLDR